MNNLDNRIKQRALWRFNDSEFHVQTSESGLHSDLYLNTDYVISDPLLVEQIVSDVFSKELEKRKINSDWVITYPPFGLAIAYALARATGTKFGYVDTKSEVCNFPIKRGEQVIVVGDDIYSGENIKKTIEIIKSLGASVQAPILTIGNFSGIEELSGVGVVSVLTEQGNLYKEKDCPMCKKGSTPVLPRPNWEKLTSH